MHGARAGDRTLFAELADVVDEARQLSVDLGSEPYRVFIVVEGWTGGETGRGDRVIVSEEELLPTPHVDYRPLQNQYQNAGTVERGGLRLTHVSPRYNEAEMRGLFRRPLCPGQASYVESRMDGRGHDPQPVRRRFVVDGAPWLDAKKFYWIVPLQEQDDRRAPNGAMPRAGRF